jgi:hypothetical protein
MVFAALGSSVKQLIPENALLAPHGINGAELKRWNSVNASDEARCAVQDPAKDPERMLAAA